MIRKMLVAVLWTAAAFAARADEGMWMLRNIDAKTASVMKDLGLTLSPEELYNPDGTSLKDAVVCFGGFCSGVVVSPDGLVFTNHHCGYGAIQSLSTPEDDILKNGFVARNHAEERPVEGLFVRFLVRMEECSGRVMRTLDSLYRACPSEPAAEVYTRHIDSILTAVERDYEKANPGMVCTAKSFYGDNAYYVSIYRQYDDIRLVFTVPETLGKFGGDTDNWMWPRQTSDFSVFRIYATPEGEPAFYSADNVPLHPRRYARVSLDGYRSGDYCMTVGYPGSTSRYLSSWGIRQRVDDVNASLIQVRGAKQEVWKQRMQADRAVAIKYASKWASSSNYWKNSIGMNKAVKELDVIGQKEQLEARIAKWYNADPSLKARFGQMFPQLSLHYGRVSEDVRARGFFVETFNRGIELFSVARRINMTSWEADSQQVAAMRESLTRFYKDYDPQLDEQTMGVLLQNYRQQVAPRFLPRFYGRIDSVYGGDCQRFAHAVFEQSVLSKPSCVDRLAEIVADSALRDTDPALVYAQDLTETLSGLYGGVAESQKIIAYNEHLLTQALLEMDQQNPHYSDANMTMRLSYGFVQDYTAQGNHYDYYTNAQSLLDKVARQHEIEDYRMEDDIVTLIRQNRFGRYADRSTGDMHLCFLSNNDITGGNSGSPMFNGKGELIGLAFDGNWEAMSGDISFNGSLQRCIGVDIRYVLFLMDKWGHADHLLREMGL